MALVERYVTATAAGGGDGSVESPWTIAEAAASAVAGERINVKAGTYLLAAALSPVADGSRDNPIEWRGYVTTPGDAEGVAATLDVNGNAAHVVDCARSYHRFRHLAATGNAAAAGRYGFLISGAHVILERCRSHATKKGILLSGAGGLALECEVDTWDIGDGLALAGSATAAVGCHIHDGPGAGILLSSADCGGALYCTVASCAGSGFQCNTSGDGYLKQVSHCVAWGNGGDGVRSNSFSLAAPFVVLNSILAANGGYGVAGHASGRPHVTLAGAAFYGNVLGEVDGNTSVFEPQPRVSLAGDPFVAAAVGDFRLAADAAALLGAGFPRAFLRGGALATWSNHPDLGAVQQAVRPVVNPLFCGAF